MKYQVAIIGGGPAGSWLARDLARKNISVVLLERSSVPGEPNFSSGGSIVSALEEFDLPRDAVAAEWDIARVSDGKSSAAWRFPSVAGVVFDFRRLKKKLLAEASASGATVLFGKEVSGLDSAGNLRTEGGEVYEAQIIVDASGPTATLSSKLGLRPEHNSPAVGIEAIFETKDHPTDQSRTLDFFLGEECAPHGYAWVFPMEQNRFKVGLCVYRLADYDLNLEKLLENFVARFQWLEGAHRIETHGGSAFMRGGIKQHASGNVLVIGDAADQINPLGGEGIRHAFRSARIASGIIVEALSKNDVSLLRKYDAAWRGYTKGRWRLAAWFADFFYPRTNTFWLNVVMFSVRGLKRDDAFAFVFETKLSVLLKGVFFSVLHLTNHD